MKKRLILASLAVTVSTVHAAPTIYGRAGAVLESADINYESSHVKDTTNTKLNNQSTRFGVKGTEALTPNTDVVYQLEYALKIDEDATQFRPRDTYLGLKNKKYGQLTAGRISTADGAADYVTMTYGMYDNDFGNAAWDGDRFNNSLAYTSPSYKGMQFLASYSMDSDQDSYGSSKTLNMPHTFAASVIYEPEKKPFRIGVGYYNGSDYEYQDGRLIDSYRISAGYDVTKNFTVNGLYILNNPKSMIDKSKPFVSKENEKVLAVSALLKTATPWEFYTQAGFIDNHFFQKDAKSTEVVLGGNYNFTPATRGLIYAGYTDSKDHTQPIYGDAPELLNFTKFGLGAGLVHKF